MAALPLTLLMIVYTGISLLVLAAPYPHPPICQMGLRSTYTL